jgi:hypothetical protein
MKELRLLRDIYNNKEEKSQRIRREIDQIN